MTASEAISIRRAAVREVGMRVDMVAREVCEATGITLALLAGRSRKARIVRARHLAMRKAYHYGASLGEIAAFFDRDHTTVLYALDKSRRVPERKGIA